MRRIAILSAILMASPTWATNNHHNDDQDNTAVGVGVGISYSDADAHADADANAVAFGGHGGRGGNADSSSVAFGGRAEGGDAVSVSEGGNANAVGIGGDQEQTQAQLQDQNQSQSVINTTSDTSTNTNSATNEGNALSSSTSFESNDRAYAIGLSQATAAPFDSDRCRIGQTAGWDVRVVARSGRNKIDALCVERELNRDYCMRLVNVYMQLNREDLAIAMLATVDCGGLAVTAPTSPEDNAARVTRMFESLQSK